MQTYPRSWLEISMDVFVTEVRQLDFLLNTGKKKTSIIKREKPFDSFLLPDLHNMQEQRSRQAENSDLTQNYLLPRSAAPLLWAVAGWELNPCRNCWGPTNPCECSFRAPTSKRSKNCSNLFYICELFTNELTKRIRSDGSYCATPRAATEQ